MEAPGKTLEPGLQSGGLDTNLPNIGIESKDPATCRAHSNIHEER